MANTYTTNYNLAKPANGDVNWHTPVNENWDKIDTQLKDNSNQLINRVPSGIIMIYGSNNLPSGWLECNGNAISRTTYSALFSIIGTTFGSGDGTTTFNLPDLRGEFVRGWDNERGVDAGRVFGSMQGDEIKSHSHMLGDYFGQGSGPYPAGGTPKPLSDIEQRTALTGGTETRPRNIALIYIIKT